MSIALAARRAALLGGIALGCSSCNLVFDRVLIAMGDGGGGPIDAEPVPDGEGPPDGRATQCGGTLEVRATGAAPTAPARPGRGETIVDPTFGTCITRVSDAVDDATAPSEPREATASLDRYFPRVAPDGSVALLSTGSYRFYAYDLLAPRRASATIVFGSQVLGFHGARPGELLTMDGDRTLARYTLLTATYTTLASLDETLPEPLASARRFRPAERPLSADGARALLVVDDPAAVVVIDTATGALIGGDVPAATGEVITRSGRWVLQADDTSVRIRSADFSDDRPLPTSGAIISAADVVVLEDGHDGLALVDGSHLVVIDLDAPTPTEVMRLPLLPEGALGRIDVDVAIDGSAVDRPGWLVITFGPCADSGTPCSLPDAWARDKISLIGIATPPVIRDLVWHREDQPVAVFAAPSRALERVVFVSSWGQSAPAEAYVVEVPEAALALR
jgi:hypothetical protein